ncbi:MAG: SDR family oxidoreductase [Paracoccaceae bacterium]
MARYASTMRGDISIECAISRLIFPAASGIAVNRICPGWTETALIQPPIQALADEHGGGWDAGIASLVGGKQPSLRTSDPAKIGQLALWLTNPIAHNITGASIPIDGGWTAQQAYNECPFGLIRGAFTN